MENLEVGDIVTVNESNTKCRIMERGGNLCLLETVEGANPFGTVHANHLRFVYRPEDRAHRVGVKQFSDVPPGTLFNLGDSTYLKLGGYPVLSVNAVYVGTYTIEQPTLEPGSLVRIESIAATTPPKIWLSHACRP